MAYTIGGLITDARNILNDTTLTAGALRYTDAELYNAFNDAMQQARAKRPDAFLDMGLRNTIPQYDPTTDSGVTFPLNASFYPAFVFYIVGRAETKEDTFGDDKRSALMMQKFVSMLLSVSG